MVSVYLVLHLFGFDARATFHWDGMQILYFIIIIYVKAQLKYCSLARLGGIIPPIARDLHEKHIDSVVRQALHTADVSLEVGLGENS